MEFFPQAWLGRLVPIGGRPAPSGPLHAGPCIVPPRCQAEAGSLQLSKDGCLSCLVGLLGVPLCRMCVSLTGCCWPPVSPRLVL